MNNDIGINDVQCIFCGNNNDINDIKGKPVCTCCLEELIYKATEMKASS